MNKIMGVYKITNIVNQKYYIGSSKNIMQRKSNHFSCLRLNTHPNKHLQNAWNKYGAENFTFNIIEYVEDYSLLIDKEQYWIDYFKEINPNNSYNQRPFAKNNSGFKHSEETKNKMSKSFKGRVYSNEHNLKLANANRGRKRSEESKKRMNDARKPREKTESERLAIKERTTGENNPATSLSNDIVIEIKKLLQQNMSNGEIHNTFPQVSKAVISRIKNGRSWKSILIPADDVSSVDGVKFD